MTRAGTFNWGGRRVRQGPVVGGAGEWDLRVVDRVELTAWCVERLARVLGET